MPHTGSRPAKSADQSIFWGEARTVGFRLAATPSGTHTPDVLKGHASRAMRHGAKFVKYQLGVRTRVVNSKKSSFSSSKSLVYSFEVGSPRVNSVRGVPVVAGFDRVFKVEEFLRPALVKEFELRYPVDRLVIEGASLPWRSENALLEVISEASVNSEVEFQPTDELCQLIANSQRAEVAEVEEIQDPEMSLGLDAINLQDEVRQMILSAVFEMAEIDGAIGVGNRVIGDLKSGFQDYAANVFHERLNLNVNATARVLWQLFTELSWHCDFYGPIVGGFGELRMDGERLLLTSKEFKLRKSAEEPKSTALKGPKLKL